MSLAPVFITGLSEPTPPATMSLAPVFIVELSEPTPPATMSLAPVFIVELSEPTPPATISLAPVFTGSLSLSKAAAAAIRLAPESPTPAPVLLLESSVLPPATAAAAGPPNPVLFISHGKRPSSAIALGSGILSPTGIPLAVVFPTIRGVVLPLSPQLIVPPNPPSNIETGSSKVCATSGPVPNVIISENFCPPAPIRSMAPWPISPNTPLTDGPITPDIPPEASTLPITFPK